MKKVILVVLILFVSSASLAGNVVKKSLGDINGDGTQEIAIEEWSSGSGGNFATIKVMANGRVVLEPIGLSGGTADGYKVVGKQIIVWAGNWNNGSKRDSHIYDFRWYRWNKQLGKFVLAKEGFTKKAYSYKQAVGIMPKLAVRSAKSIVLSNKSTFADDAVALAVKKFGQGLKVRSVREAGVDNLYPNCVHYFEVSLGSEKRSVLVGVMFLRDGRYKLDATT